MDSSMLEEHQTPLRAITERTGDCSGVYDPEASSSGNRNEPEPESPEPGAGQAGARRPGPAPLELEAAPAKPGPRAGGSAPEPQLPSMLDMIRPSKGDLSCFFALLMDNLGTILVVCSVTFGSLCGVFGEKGAPKEVTDHLQTVIYKSIVPGLVPTILIGSAYYSWMALRILQGLPAGASITALPYGLNTPASFIFIFGIVVVACKEHWEEWTSGGGSEQDVSQMIKAVDAGLAQGIAANMVGGLISMACALVGPGLVRMAPGPALMIALAGIGFTFLGLLQVLQCAAHAQIGMFTLLLGTLLALGIVRTGVVPPVVALLVIGTSMGWIGSAVGWVNDPDMSSEKLKEAASHISFGYPKISMEAFTAISGIGGRMSELMPVAFSGAIGTVLNVQAAKEQGDNFPMWETLLVDGFTTCIAAVFGSPFPTCVYIGHTQLKRMGGKLAYPVQFGLAYTVLACAGALQLMQVLVPKYAIQPVIVLVGVSIFSQTFEFSEKRHLPACCFGLFPALASFVTEQFNPRDEAAWQTLQALGKGAMIVSVLWCSILITAIDRHFLAASGWCAGAAALSAVGMIHAARVGDIGAGRIGVRPLDFTVGYSIAVAMFLVLAFVQRFYPDGDIVSPPFCESEAEDPKGKIQRVGSGCGSFVDLTPSEKVISALRTPSKVSII